MSTGYKVQEGEFSSDDLNGAIVLCMLRDLQTNGRSSEDFPGIEQELKLDSREMVITVVTSLVRHSFAITLAEAVEWAAWFCAQKRLPLHKPMWDKHIALAMGTTESAYQPGMSK